MSLNTYTSKIQCYSCLCNGLKFEGSMTPMPVFKLKTVFIVQTKLMTLALLFTRLSYYYRTMMNKFRPGKYDLTAFCLLERLLSVAHAAKLLLNYLRMFTSVYNVNTLGAYRAAIGRSWCTTSVADVMSRCR